MAKQFIGESVPPLTRRAYAAGIRAREKAIGAALSILLSASDPNLASKYIDGEKRNKYPINWLDELRKDSETTEAFNSLKVRRLANEVHRLILEKNDFVETQQLRLDALRKMRANKPKTLPRANLARRLRRK
ncbi:Uncharacterised protein [uncultured archaeon]|nr:Uncharacterised protein [uncultured archaeon]